MNEAEFRAAATKAFELHRAGRLSEAEAAYRNILDTRPDTPEILQLLGTLLGQANRLDEARATLTHATRLQPGNADAQYNLAECLFRLDDRAGAADAYRAAITAMPAHIEAAIGLSGLLLAADGAREAADVTRAALRHAPDHPALHAQLGAALLDMDDAAQARKHLETAVRLAPDHALARRNLATALIRLEEFAPAIELLRPLVNAEPRSVELLQLAALALSASGQHMRARPAAERILEIDPDNLEAINLLSDIAGQLGDGELALEYARRAAELAPDNAQEAARVAELLERLSQLDAAQEWTQRALERAPDNTLALITAARLARRSSAAEEALDYLEQINTDSERPWLAASILFERGQAQESLGRHNVAFATFEAAHAKRAGTRQMRTRDPDRHMRMQDALLEMFESANAPELIAGWRRDLADEDDRSVPSFLVGYPRSGTTLVERLLDAHNHVVATPELPMVDAMRNAIDTRVPGGSVYPGALNEVGAEEISRLRTVYWDVVAELHAEAVGDKLLVDKHPLNLDHLGLIARIFPGAKVLVALRDPRDVCVSCFTTDFAPNNVTIRYRDLLETARAYAATMRLWLRYREILPLEFHPYRYEDLTRDPRGVLGDIVAFLGLDWHDGLLESADQNVGRYVNTPSYTGVTEQVNSRAVGRWQGYAEQLEPAMPLLQPYIEAFGYDEPGPV